jgi:hypothetical protein
MFEYKIMESQDLANEENLKVFSNDAWELVTIIQHRGMFYYYFKRINPNQRSGKC